MVGRIRLAARFSDEEMRTISEICQILRCSPQDLTRRAVLLFTNEMADAILRDVEYGKDVRAIAHSKEIGKEVTSASKFGEEVQD